MNRIWGLFFLAVPVVAFSVTALAAWGWAPLAAYWLPENYSREGETIDQLFHLFHGVAAVVLLGTGFTLAWCIFRYGSSRQASAKYWPHQTLLEWVWTLVPAGVLVFLALFQMESWNRSKSAHPLIQQAGQSVPQPPLVRVVAKRFGWEFHHAGLDGQLQTADDLYVENWLLLPAGEAVVLQLESSDVIHSFFVPGLRVKQDLVPGMEQQMWFEIREPIELEILCTELCGWGHYTMQARLQGVSRSDYDRWLREETHRRQPELAEVGE